MEQVIYPIIYKVGGICIAIHKKDGKLRIQQINMFIEDIKEVIMVETKEYFKEKNNCTAETKIFDVERWLF